MQDFAVFKVCSLPVPGQRRCFCGCTAKKTQKNDDDDKQSITMLATAVKILVLNQQIPRIASS